MLPYSGSPLVLLVPLLIRVANVIMITMVITSPITMLIMTLIPILKKGIVNVFIVQGLIVASGFVICMFFQPDPHNPPSKS